MNAAHPPGTCRTCNNRIPWHWLGFWGGVVLFVMGASCGLFFGMSAYDAGKYGAGVRESVRDACIGGNANACRVYEIDYGKEGGW